MSKITQKKSKIETKMTSKKMLICNRCNKVFDRKDRLIKHLQKFTCNRNLTCSLCDITFKRFANL